MNALLLAGGFGTRLQPLTCSVPKALVSVGKVPLLQIWFEMLFEAGVERIVVNTHYLGHVIRNFCSQSVYSSSVDLFHEEFLLGTAGTLRACQTLLNNGAFWLIHADNYSCFDPSEMLKAHLSRPIGCIGTMMTFLTDTPEQCGIVELDSSGVLVTYHEKVSNPPGLLANGAVFIFEQEIFSFLKDLPQATDFCRDVVPSLVGRIFAFHNNNFHIDIGTPDGYMRANLRSCP